MNRLADEMRSRAERAVSAMIGQESGDIVHDFAEVLSVDVTSAFVGLPPADGGRVKAWVTDWFELFRTPHPRKRAA